MGHPSDLLRIPNNRRRPVVAKNVSLMVKKQTEPSFRKKCGYIIHCHTHTKSSSRSCEDIDVIHFPKLWRCKALVPHPSTKHAVWSSYRSFQVQDMTNLSWSNHPGKDVAETGRIPSPQQLWYMHSNKISGTRCTSQEPVFDMTGWRPQSLRWECSDVGLGPCGRWHFSSENMHR